MDTTFLIIGTSSEAPKKTRNRTSKYTEEEKKERLKASQAKYFNKQEIKERQSQYYKERYENLTEEEKKKYMENTLTKYYNMTDEEYKNFLIKCRPYKRKYNHKKADEKKLLEEEQKKIINKERENIINNRTINAMKDSRYNDYIINV